MRGIAGHPADTDRDTGFKKALEEYPDIKVVKEDRAPTGIRQTAVDQINDILAQRPTKFDGIWTSGIDNVIVDAIVRRSTQLVPVVGADNAGFVKQLLDRGRPQGRGGHQPSGRRRRRCGPRPKLLAGDKPADPNVHVTPELWDNTTEAGKAALTAANDTTLARDLAPRADRRGLDHLSQGRRQGVQGPGRVTPRATIQCVRGCRFTPASPCDSRSGTACPHGGRTSQR